MAVVILIVLAVISALSLAFGVDSRFDEHRGIEV